MKRELIPSPIIAVVSDIVATSETHASLDNLFMYAGAPGDPPEGSKPVKAQAWLRLINKDNSIQPLEVLGRIIESYMEAECDPEFDDWADNNAERKQKLESALNRAELKYVKGGSFTGQVSTPSKTLQEIIKGRDLKAIDEEFERALKSVESNPRDAVSAASNILESLCKTYIADEGLDVPKKQDLKGVWGIVKKDLNFDPAQIEDRDLKEILSGLFAIVSGVSALRTHASTAHGAGRTVYKIEPRHARLAVHGAHTVTAFIIETWDKRKKTSSHTLKRTE